MKHFKFISSQITIVDKLFLVFNELSNTTKMIRVLGICFAAVLIISILIRQVLYVRVVRVRFHFAKFVMCGECVVCVFTSCCRVSSVAFVWLINVAHKIDCIWLCAFSSANQQREI